MFKAKTYEKNQADAMLKIIGITEAELKQVVLAGQMAKTNASILYPQMFPGYLGYAERVKSLRDILLPKGWKMETERGLEMVVSPDGKTAILTSLGDDNTGDATKVLKTKNRKGDHTASLVEANAQMSFFDTISMEDRGIQLEEKSYWYLMVHVSADEIRYELSRPVKLDDENKLCQFSERIILDPISMDGLVKPDIQKKRDEKENEVGDDFDVAISKKA